MVNFTVNECDMTLGFSFVLLLRRSPAASLLFFFGIYLFLLFLLVVGSIVADNGILGLLLLLQGSTLSLNSVILVLLLLKQLKALLFFLIDGDVAKGDHIRPRLHLRSFFLQAETFKAACVKFV